FLRFFVAHFRRSQRDLHDLVALRALPCVGYAAISKTELLVVLRAWRNFEQRLAFDGGHFDLRAQAGFPDGDRHFHVDVVAFAAEHRMRLDVRGDVEIAGRRAHGAGVAFARNSEPRAVLRARGNAHVDEFLVGDTSIAVAVRAGI